MFVIIWSRHCLDASTAFLSGQCVYIFFLNLTIFYIAKILSEYFFLYPSQPKYFFLKIQHQIIFFSKKPSISEVNKWGMFCFDLVIFFCNTEVIPGKNVVLCNVLYVFFCNSGQFSFFHVLLNEKHSIYSQNLPFLQFFVVIQWFQMEMSEYLAWI